MKFDKAWTQFEISRIKSDAENVLNYIDAMYEESYLESDRDAMIYYEELSETLTEIVDLFKITKGLL